MARLRTLAKLGCVFGALLFVPAIFIAIFGVVNFYTVSGGAVAAIEPLERYRIMRGLEVQIMGLRRIAVASAYLAGDAEAIDEMEDILAAARGSALETLGELAGSFRNDETIESDTLRSLLDQVAGLENMIFAYMSMLEAYWLPAARADDVAGISNLRPASEAMIASMSAQLDELLHNDVHIYMEDRDRHNIRTVGIATARALRILILPAGIAAIALAVRHSRRESRME